MKKGTETKVQTGLRLPEKRYEELAEAAQNAGVSLNSLLLSLIEAGLRTVNLGIQEERHAFLHSLEDKDE